MQNQAAEQVVKTLKEANNVLVTVKNSPSVDELTAAIGLTLILNRMDKHAVTVFSGRVPSTLEFLQPEMAIDTTTDSLRDFIIALDKSKADKLRYKVEDNVVRIFITPYKSSITEKDLDFSQGDFNVDAVVALGVVTKEDFDQAVTAHGRILHDATVVALTNHDVVSQIGAINWQESQASSISEMVTSITDQLGPDVLDGQIATSLLTGIVAETDRFKNANTTPQVLSLSSKLMSAGANQQLIAEKLEAPDMSSVGQPLIESPSDSLSDDGALEINHDNDEIQKIHIDDSGNLQLPVEKDLPLTQELNENLDDSTEVKELEEKTEPESQSETSRTYIKPDKPPKLYGQDDSGTVTEQPLMNEAPKPVQDPKPASSNQDVSTHKQKVIEPIVPASDEQSQTSATPEPASVVGTQTVTTPTVDTNLTPNPPVNQTLTDLEESVRSAHVSENSTPSVPSTNVDDFLGTSRPQTPPAQVSDTSTQQDQPAPEPTPPQENIESEVKEEETSEPTPQVVDSTAPPAVPPPLMPQASPQPQFFDADGSNANPFLNPNQ